MEKKLFMFYYNTFSSPLLALQLKNVSQVVAGEMPASEFGFSPGTVLADVRGVIMVGVILYSVCFLVLLVDDFGLSILKIAMPVLFGEAVFSLCCLGFLCFLDHK